MLDELKLKQDYDDYLQEVRQEQLYQQLKQSQSNWQQKILKHLGDLLIITGHHLQGQKRLPGSSSTTLNPR